MKSLIKSTILEVFREIPLHEKIDEFLSQKDVCNLFKVSESTLIRWKRAGIIKAKKIGRRVFYSKIEIKKRLDGKM